ncbi:MAG: TPM domain-containing protein [Clostridiales bacterium]|nr:TPM domain-containing protein [Clostridiales bacterium]
MSSTEKKKNNKVSIFGEMGMMSFTAIVCMIAVVLGCVAFYLFMSSSPKKHVIVDDEADIFTNAEENELERLASSLSKEEDINVVIVTTRDKGRGYTNSDEDCARYAGDYYADKCIKTSLVNNSGICIFIDLTIDEPGQRFFWIYTYGTAYFAIDDDECYHLFNQQRQQLSDADYFGALENIFGKLDDYDYESVSSMVFFTLLIPALLSFLITWLCTSPKGLDKKPKSKVYEAASEGMDFNDKLVRTRKIRHESSGGGGGGFSGGGGGFGGGGHSGGGGGRF